MNDLKSCPFCGGRAETLLVSGAQETNEIYVQCCDCGAMTKPILAFFDDNGTIPLSAVMRAATDAEERWNRRAEDEL